MSDDAPAAFEMLRPTLESDTAYRCVIVDSGHLVVLAIGIPDSHTLDEIAVALRVQELLGRGLLVLL